MLIRKSKITASEDKKSRIYAADEEPTFDFGDFGGTDDEDEDEDDAGDDNVDTESEDIEDEEVEQVEVEEDEENIEVENNIANHYIAECDKCHGIFISAVEKSEMQVESIVGICPICDKESEQFLKWIIEEVDWENMD